MAISGELQRILAPEIHKHHSKPKGANARDRQSSPEFVRVRQSSPGFVRVRRSSQEFAEVMSTDHKAFAPQTTLKTELREHCKIPNDAMDRQMELDWKDKKETSEKIAS